MAGTIRSAPGAYKAPAGYRKSICVSISKKTVFISVPSAFASLSQLMRRCGGQGGAGNLPAQRALESQPGSALPLPIVPSKRRDGAAPQLPADNSPPPAPEHRDPTTGTTASLLA